MKGQVVEKLKELGGSRLKQLVLTKLVKVAVSPGLEGDFAYLLEAEISLPVNDPQGLAERWNRLEETHLTWRKDRLVLRHYALPETPVEEEVGHFLNDLYRLLRLLVREGEKAWAGARA